MADTPSTMLLPLRTKMPAFSLPDFDGTIHQSTEYEGKPVLVAFICNHCPFVKHVAAVFSSKAREYQEMGVGVVAITSNDVDSHPEDAPEKMREFADEHGFTFPYLYDESQEVAKSFKAACTPDFFLFDSDHRLAYRGQFDDSRPSKDVPVTGSDLTEAVKAVASGKEVPGKQKSSLGCNIKWKPDNEPEYYGN